MEIVKDYFQNFDFVSAVELCKVIVPVLLALLLFFKTGNSKHLETTLTSLLYTLNNKEEVSDMVYRKQHYKEGEKTPGQTFSNLKPVYRLNKVNKVLEKTDDVIDIQEVIDSCKDACLNSVLERFFPTQEVDAVSVLPQLQDDLDVMLECSEIAEDYRQKLNLSPDLSISQVFEKMKDYQTTLSEKLNKKEVSQDVEKKTKQESEQPKL